MPNAFDLAAVAEEEALIDALGMQVSYLPQSGGTLAINAIVDTSTDYIDDGSRARYVTQHATMNIKTSSVAALEGDQVVIDGQTYVVMSPIQDAFGCTHCYLRAIL